LKRTFEAITALNKLLKSTALMYDLILKSFTKEFGFETACWLRHEALIPIIYIEILFGKGQYQIQRAICTA